MKQFLLMHLLCVLQALELQQLRGSLALAEEQVQNVELKRES